MARIVVRNRDKVNEDDPYLDAMCMKRGMVVDILPDGQSLGSKGDVYDGWTVIDVPGASVADLSAFLASEPGDRILNRTLQRRAFKLDLDGLFGVAAARSMTVMAGAEHTASSSTTITLERALELKVAVAPLSDPNIL
jgi:hypothetical protein